MLVIELNTLEKKSGNYYDMKEHVTFDFNMQPKLYL